MVSKNCAIFKVNYHIYELLGNSPHFVYKTIANIKNILEKTVENGKDFRSKVGIRKCGSCNQGKYINEDLEVHLEDINKAKIFPKFGNCNSKGFLDIARCVTCPAITKE